MKIHQNLWHEYNGKLIVARNYLDFFNQTTRRTNEMQISFGNFCGKIWTSSNKINPLESEHVHANRTRFFTCCLPLELLAIRLCVFYLAFINKTNRISFCLAIRSTSKYNWMFESLFSNRVETHLSVVMSNCAIQCS